MDFVELARQFADDPSVVFFMVGEGPLGSVVSAQIQRLGLANLVQHPFHKPFSELLAVTDLLVLPSEYEGMPMVVVESLAMGIPVVATDVGNNREVLERTGGGVVVHVGDVGGMRRAVRQLLADPPDAAALRAAVENAFQLGPMADAYYRAFTEVVPQDGKADETAA
jgi:glycosyltransferase involved in cell wall biosynthesis